jgi:hypothetical protein
MPFTAGIKKIPPYTGIIDHNKIDSLHKNLQSDNSMSQ